MRGNHKGKHISKSKMATSSAKDIAKKPLIRSNHIINAYIVGSRPTLEDVERLRSGSVRKLYETETTVNLVASPRQLAPHKHHRVSTSKLIVRTINRLKNNKTNCIV